MGRWSSEVGLVTVTALNKKRGFELLHTEMLTLFLHQYL